MIQGNYNNIPGTLKALPNWVGFRVWRDEKENKYKKMPIDIKASVAAKKADPARWQDVPAESNNPKTWCDFDTAVSWAKSKKSGNKYFWYIGFAFDGGGLCGIDLDKCVGADNGLSAFAQEVLGEVQSYAEYSPTGTGVHIIARHTKPFAARKNAVIEAYNNGRFFTVTGAGLADRTTDVNDCTDAVLGVIEKQFGMPNGENADGGDGALLPLSPREAREIKSLKFKEPPEDSWTDSKIIERAKAARRTGSEFTALYAGDWRSQGFPSQSEADLALCGRLAFWTRRDFSQIDRIFRSSGLYRPKWDKAHYGGGVTYGENTIAKAIRDCGTTYGDNTTQRKRQAKVQGQTDTATVNASQATVSGVYIADNAYYMDKGKDVKRLTNFIIEPLEIVTVDNENSMNVRLKNTRGNTAVVRLRFTDFNSVSAMRGAIGALDFITVCSDTELQYIRDFVSQLPCPEKRGYKGIGIDFVDDGSGFKKPAFVCASGTFGKDWTPVDSVVQAAGSIKIESEVHIPHPISKEDLLTVGKILFSYNELPKTAAVLCFTAGCFLKPHLMQSDLKYPHLIMSGEAGSGKSSTYAKVIKPIMSLEKPVSVGDITPFTFLADACSSNFLPFVVDEYKPWEMSKSNLDMIHGALRNLYDGQKGERGRADQTVVKYFMTAVMILMGEASPSETAIKERSIEILFSKLDLVGRKSYVEELDRVQSILRSLGKSLLLAALDETPGNIKFLFGQTLDKVPAHFEPRIRHNITAVLMGLYLVTKVCTKTGTTFKETFGIETAEVKAAIIQAVSDYTLDGGKSKSVIEHTLEIMDRMTPAHLKKDCHFALQGGAGKQCIAFNFKSIYDLYTEYIGRHNIDAEKLSYGGFTKQLRKKSYFVDYAAVKLRAEPFGGDKKGVQCFWLNIDEVREACDIENILAEAGYIPPSPPRKVYKQAGFFSSGDGTA